MKRCSKCLVEKALSGFREAKAGKYGRSAQCKECDATYFKDYNRNKRGSGDQPVRDNTVIEMTEAGKEALVLQRTLDILVAAGIVNEDEIGSARMLAAKKWGKG